MRKLLMSLSLVAAIAAPVAAHADSIMTGQFSVQGTVQNVGTTLYFTPTVTTGVGTQTGTFATLLTDLEHVTSGPTAIQYNPYVCCAVFTLGSTPATTLTATLETFVEQTIMINGQPVLGFSGTALFSAPGYVTTPGSFTFSTQDSGPVTFSATAITTGSQVPEPSTLALFGTGALGLAGLVSRKLIA